MTKIEALTISTLGTEFVVHVPDEYDYRYASTDKFLYDKNLYIIFIFLKKKRRDKIISNIVKAFNLHCNKKMPCYFKLKNYF